MALLRPIPPLRLCLYQVTSSWVITSMPEYLALRLDTEQVHLLNCTTGQRETVTVDQYIVTSSLYMYEIYVPQPMEYIAWIMWIEVTFSSLVEPMPGPDLEKQGWSEYLACGRRGRQPTGTWTSSYSAKEDSIKGTRNMKGLVVMHFCVL